MDTKLVRLDAMETNVVQALRSMRQACPYDVEQDYAGVCLVMAVARTQDVPGEPDNVAISPDWNVCFITEPCDGAIQELLERMLQYAASHADLDRSNAMKMKPMEMEEADPADVARQAIQAAQEAR